jgi:hypothetical protein
MWVHLFIIDDRGTIFRSPGNKWTHKAVGPPFYHRLQKYRSTITEHARFCSPENRWIHKAVDPPFYYRLQKYKSTKYKTEHARFCSPENRWTHKAVGPPFYHRLQKYKSTINQWVQLFYHRLRKYKYNNRICQRYPQELSMTKCETGWEGKGNVFRSPDNERCMLLWSPWLLWLVC